jgi:hypothetical protein
MGEAKRRKLLDPNYGKPKPIVFRQPQPKQAQTWYEQMVEQIQGTNFREDFGHNILVMFKRIKVMHCSLCGEFIQFPQTVNGRKYIAVNSIISGQAALILLSKSTFDRWSQDQSILLTIVPNIEDRYLTQSRQSGIREWVIPMYEFTEGVDQIEEIAA